MVPGVATGFTLAWPALQNYKTFTGIQVWFQYRLWVDDIKPPLKG